ncbi:DUF1697 domain-containing protein [Microbacterium sp. SSM24]|uniref:DUF1697 domain-containing protein n=1 Tax=Microbacterium sp. SSM24 TaxID=2991714 RepID=UPI0022275B40|nr:DUF1697 domain-containing protein [Microbacterium sp. SSM24]MCW3493121.1 DUF1697 domain-containing protein [Microbacterium sp. SSM24]
MSERRREDSATNGFVAFFRNVNQGQRGHPTTADLLGALADAGFTEAVTFQSNGTVVFSDAAPSSAVTLERAARDAAADPADPANPGDPAVSSDSAGLRYSAAARDAAADPADPRAAVDPRAVSDVRNALNARTGIEREVFVMLLQEIVDIVAAYSLADDAARRELTLHRGGVVDIGDPSVVTEAARRRCRLLACGPGWTLASNERDRESNATPVVEHLTGGPATSRGLSTLVRLVERFAR